MVERFVRRLREQPDLSALTCYVAAMREGEDRAGAWDPHDSSSLSASLKNVYSGGIFRTEDLRAVAGDATYHGGCGQDWVGFFSLVNAGYRVDILPLHLFYYLIPADCSEHTTIPTSDRVGVLRPFFDADRHAAAEKEALWGALAELQEKMERTTAENRRQVDQLTQQNQSLQTQLNSLRYRIADRMNALWSRMPVSKKRVKQLLTMFS
jgi:hypothetical protein